MSAGMIYPKRLMVFGLTTMRIFAHDFNRVGLSV